MAGGIRQRNLNSDWRLCGVYSSAANYLIARNKASAVEGDVYYDTTLNQLRTYDGSNWSPAGQSGISAGSLTDAYNIGQTITLTSSNGMTITCPDDAVSAGPVLLIENAEDTDDITALQVTDAGAGICIDIDGTTGDDIQGTNDTWAVDYLGVGEFSSLFLADTKTIQFGDTVGDPDWTLAFDATQLEFIPADADAKFAFGDGTPRCDVKIYGTTAAAYVEFDGSADEALFVGYDIGLQDDDQLIFGSSDDVKIDWENAGNFQITPLAANQTVKWGASATGFEIYWYGDTASRNLRWSSTYDRLLFESDASAAVDVMCQLDDWVQLTFGTGAGFGTTGTGDVQMWFDGTDFKIDALVADEGFKIGDTASGFDITYYFEGSGPTITTDYDGDVMTFNDCDLALGDGDYILLGDSATATGTNDGTIRWDNTDAKIEIVGATRFEQAVTMDGALTVTGTFTHTGSFAPGSLALGDDEALNFGDSSDVAIHYDDSTKDLQINGAAAQQGIDFGADYVVDVRFSGSTANYDMQWDASRNHLLFNDGAMLAFGGTNDTTADYKISTAGSTGPLIITAIAANDRVQIGDGTVATDFLIDNVANSGSDIWWDESAQIFYYGADGKGVDVTLYGETTGANMTWDQSQDALIFTAADLNIADNDLITIGTGASAGAGDWKIHSNGADLFIAEVSAADKEIDFGVDGTAPDVKFFGDTTGVNMLWDQSTDSLVISDLAHIKFGAGTDLDISTSGAGFVFNSLASSTFSSTTANQQLIIGTTIVGMDLRCNLTTSATSYLLWDASSDSGKGALILGCDDEGIDLTLYGATTGITCAWDQSADALELGDNAKLVIGAGADLTISTTGAVATTLNVGGSTTATNLQISSTTVNGQTIVGTTLFGMDFRCNVTTSATSFLLFDASHDSGIGGLLLGLDDLGMDLQLFGATSGITAGWDQSADAFLIGDNTELRFGTGNDLVISTTNANAIINTAATLTFSSSAANQQIMIGTTVLGVDLRFNTTTSATAYLIWDASHNSGGGGLLFGADDNGVDAVFYGATTGCNFTWDASADSLLSGSNAVLSFTNANGTTTENIFILPSLTKAASLTTVVQGSMILDGQNDILYVATAAGTWKSVGLT